MYEKCAVYEIMCKNVVEASWNVMAHAQKPDLFFRRNERVHLNRRGRQFSRLLAAEVCASTGVMLDTPCSEVVWRVLVTHSIRQLPLHFSSRASPCAITFQLESRAGQATDDDLYIAYALHAGYLRLQTHTLRICTTYCFCTATIFSREYFIVTFVHILPVFLCIRNFLLRSHCRGLCWI